MVFCLSTFFFFFFLISLSEVSSGDEATHSNVCVVIESAGHNSSSDGDQV